MLLVALPSAINLPFAFAGRPLMGGDNLDQNFPLRVLSGQLIGHGRLPLWNPDIWSGAPLLAGWNAGAMFPGTWLFAILPGVAAWELNVIGVGAIGAIGLHVFLRRQGCSAVASLLGALTFSYTGFMSAQSVHIGLVTGMALAPWMLIALDQAARASAPREVLRPAAFLGFSAALVVLAGDPRAISNDAVVVAAYLVALCWRRRRSPGGLRRIAAAAAGGSVLAAALSAAQWLPGLAFLHQSQRASGSLAYFGSYSLSGGQLAYLVSPFVFGGNGSLGLPTTNFNLPEYTYAVGLLPLVAFFVLGCRAIAGALARRARSAGTGARGAAGLEGRDARASAGPEGRDERAAAGPGGRDERAAAGPRERDERTAAGPRERDVLAVAERPAGAFLVLAVIGVVLASGTNMPLGHLLVHVPLYGGERLQVRNMGITDLALAVLVAFFLDLLGSPSPAGSRPAAGSRPPAELLAPAERVSGALPPLMVVALVTAMLVATAPTERFLGATALVLGLPARMAPYYAFELVIALGAAVVVGRRSWRKPTHRRQLAILLTGLDIAMFVAMASYQPAPSAALATANPAVDQVIAAAGGAAGRDAIFNPQQLQVVGSPQVLDDLGLDDLVVLHHLQSVQGYGSAVAASYEAATGAHEVENLRPSAFLGTTFESLDLRVLVTLPELFGSVRLSPLRLALPTGQPVASGTSAADRQAGDAVAFGRLPPAGPWRLGTPVVFELPGPLAVDAVALRIAPATPALSRLGSPRPRVARPARFAVVVILRSGARRTIEVGAARPVALVHVPVSWTEVGGGVLDVEVAAANGHRRGRASPSPLLRAVAVHSIAWAGGVPVASSLGSLRGAWFELDGMLQGLLAPARWVYQGHDGPVLLYRNALAYGMAWLQPAGSSGAVTARRAPGSATPEVRAVWQDPTEVVAAPAGALLVRSETFAPGWSVTIVPERPALAGTAPGAVAGAVAVALPVIRVGLLQGVELPPGRWIVAWHYHSAAADAGLAGGALGVAALCPLLIAGRARDGGRRRRASSRDGRRRRRASSRHGA